MKNKKTILIITITFFIFLIASATYAFFRAQIDVETNLNFAASFDGLSPSFTAYVEKDMNLEIYSSDMLKNTVVASKTNDGTVIVELTSAKDGTDAVCSYNIEYVWDSADEYVPSTSLPVSSDEGTSFPYELSIKGTRLTQNDDEYTYQNKDLGETNLDKLSWQEVDGKRAVIVENAEIHSKSSTVASKTIWTFTMSFYSLPVNQNVLLGKNFKGHLVITNISC